METLLLWIGLAASGAGLALALRRDLPFLRNPVRRTSAVIVRHELRRKGGAMLYTPIFRFLDETGQPVEVRDRLVTPFPTPVIGERLGIAHPQGMPHRARIPYPVFRALFYGLFGYAFVVLVLAVTGQG
ncbi:hypothetical protein [Parasphingorhabdus sp.]|uniref:hypothetical protein n=1 Tax=Parasphingorhabdus sp. TaxID=2709688 RepID=UPI003002EF33